MPSNHTIVRRAFLGSLVGVLLCAAAAAGYWWLLKSRPAEAEPQRVAVLTSAGPDSVPLYGTYELEMRLEHTGPNPFEVFLPVRFRSGGRLFTVDAFHDGDDTWRARFMPDAPGEWNYEVVISGMAAASGSFWTLASADSLNHGHVRVDAQRPRYLAHDDGSPHYWFGCNWIAAENYGPPEKNGESNPNYLSDEQIQGHLNLLERFRHNGTLLKMALFPLEDDGVTWDLSWIRRGEWIVREAGRRGIYVHVNMFDTWSRERGSPFTFDTHRSEHVLNAWSEEDAEKRRNYLRTIIARFAAFHNVYWELGNEMEHRPNDGNAFAKRSNLEYLPWIREFDPYDLPVGLSEDVWKQTTVDIGFLHQGDELPPPDSATPLIMNELVRGTDPVVGTPMWMDETIRDPRARLSYRRVFWQMFTRGGCGSSEATWLNLKEPPNGAVLDVMGDQRQLRAVLEGLPISWNEMTPDNDLVADGPDGLTVRGKRGEAYVGYLLGPEDAGTLTLRLDPGQYVLTWQSPSTGEPIVSTSIEAGDGPVAVEQPPVKEDLAFTLIRATP